MSTRLVGHPTDPASEISLESQVDKIAQKLQLLKTALEESNASTFSTPNKAITTLWESQALELQQMMSHMDAQNSVLKSLEAFQKTMNTLRARIDEEILAKDNTILGQSMTIENFENAVKKMQQQIKENDATIQYLLKPAKG